MVVRRIGSPENLPAALAEARAALEPGHERPGARGAQRRSLALVPTMGFLHEGHLRLIREARELAEAVALSLFVNPLQFGRGEDLDRYPRDLERDLEIAEAEGVDLVFAPSLEEMFPGGPPTVRVDPGPPGRRLCGEFRPGHFEGVLTIVARLFGLFLPDVAVFGRKDYQQSVLVRRMVRDLAYPVRIHVGPLVREADGLALSSRNAYLSRAERAHALGLVRGLTAAAEAHAAGERRAAGVLKVAREVLAGFPGLRLQYLELVDPETLDPLAEAREGGVLAVAALCGATRLIDNVVLGGDPDPRVPDGDEPG